MTDNTEIKNGYVLLARVIQDSEIWRDDPHVLKLFVYLIMKARQKKEPERYPHFKIRRGELVTSLAQIAEDNKYFNRTVKSWSRAKVSRMLNQLQEQGYIELLADTYGTHVKICKYETYQNPENYKRTLVKRKRNDSETIVRTNNNDNNVNNDKNDIKKGQFEKPNFEEVNKYCQENNYDIDPGAFIDFYEAKGWMIGKNKMKSWQAAVRTWVRNNKQGSNKKVTSFDRFRKARAEERQNEKE